MTTTTKLNSRELLSQLASSNSSGCLQIEEGSVSWKIYLQQGDLKYVFCSIQLLDQLKYYLHYLGYKPAAAALKNLPPSYVKIQSHLQDSTGERHFYSQVVSWLLDEKHLDLSQGLQLLELITKDFLQSLLWIDKGTSSWYDGHSLPLWIQQKFGHTVTLNVSECLKTEEVKLKKWKSCSEQLLSVHQRPYFTSGWSQKSLPSSGLLNHQTLKELAQIIRGRTSIRQLSLLLQKDELYVAQILSPYIDSKIIYLRDAQPPLDRLPNIPKLAKDSQQSSQVGPVSDNQNPNNYVKTWKIVCVDDSPTILKEIKRFLNQDKFEVIAIDDPIQAVSKIFRIKPDLILLDITMPKINGYKLCGLLRNSKYCNHTPIIMVTGNTGLIDKARAKLAGATDYFTKPFTQEGLMNIVETHLK
ncbi:MAG: response regulator [Pleurocapsa sp.]